MLSNKKSWKLVSITLVAVLALSLLSACGKSSENVVATYKGGELTLDEYNIEKKVLIFLSPQYAQLAEMEDFKTYLVNQQVAFEYLSDKATKEAKEAGKKLAVDQLDQMKEQVGEDAFKKMLDEQELKETDLKGYLEQVMISMQDMTDKVTDEEVKKQYEATKQDFTIASVRHVLISLTDANQKARTKEEALKLAKDVKSKLDKGEDFATIAKKYSDDKGSAENGGLYENTPAGTWVEAFKQSAVTLPLNTISDPVETDYGYHILKVESRTETPFDKLTQVQKDAIKNTVGSKKIDDFMSKDLKDIIKKVNLPKSPEAKTDEKTPTPETGTDTKTDTKTDAKTDETKTEATTP
ncbi:peptidylprolyl isomerase [Paenibacillus glacialis]|uniref:PpiC domain-containing protein n=1 Tax=Paenibacillus glacialis TaxID=494026 RepID=A0A162MDR1_9BACL|nr:peptidylprolyl isomerase [Paenibacillus glacialis]OAB42733.1 hypothetical protein PGLA_11410 [Paenibacillus glacialis]